MCDTEYSTYVPSSWLRHLALPEKQWQSGSEMGRGDASVDSQ